MLTCISCEPCGLSSVWAESPVDYLKAHCRRGLRCRAWIRTGSEDGSPDAEDRVDSGVEDS